MMIGESGERKSEVDGIVLKPVHQADKARTETFVSDSAAYKANFQIWKVKEAALISRLKKAVQSDEPTGKIEVMLTEHHTTKPTKPRLRRYVRSDATERAFMEALEGDGEAMLLSADEGHIVLDSGAINRVGYRNAFWGGADLTIDRAGGEHVVVCNPRASISLMLQPAVLKRYLDRRGELARGSGHLARYLIGWPVSTQGTRFGIDADPVWQHLPEIHVRMTALLEEYDNKIKSGQSERMVIEFSEEATVRWREMVNRTESMLQPSGYLRDINDFGSKAMEIVARVAAILHHFTKQDGRISVDTLNRAIALVRWHLHEFKRIFSPEFEVPQVQIDAQAVEAYLQTHFFGMGIQSAPRNAVLRSGPVRPEARLRDAIDYLQQQLKIWIGIGPNRKRYINPGPNWGRT
jgi:hypothetical protein